MPQMAPYNWMMLFLFFNFIMICIISMNYYQSLPTPIIKKFKGKKNYFQWMW